MDKFSRLAFVVEILCVFCAVGTQPSKFILINSRLQIIKI